MIKFSNEEKKIGEGIFKKFDYGRLHKHKWPIADFDEILGVLTKEERILIDKILKINPRDFGKKEPFYGIRPVPKNLIFITNQKYEINGELRTVKPQYLPEDVYRSFLKLNNAMQDDIGRSINVLSGYRSPAYQLVIFFYYLFKHKWDLNKVLGFAALPGWSEHELPEKQGMDLSPRKGIAYPKDFYKTKEYKWLLKNAKKFGFYLSFPKENKKGVIFEPWHWHHKGKK